MANLGQISVHTGARSNARRRLLLLAAGFGLTGAPLVSVAGKTEVVTVFAAASLKNALDACIQHWHGQQNDRARIAYAGTATLARQILRGAPAQFFISADQAWMNRLIEQQRVDAAQASPLISNRLVLIAPANASTPRQSMTELGPTTALAAMLGEQGRFAIANTDYVPAGRYAKAALQGLQLWAGIKKRLVETNNVRLALALVARGECPLGMVYQSDAHSEPAVTVISEIPTRLHPPIVYPMAVLSDPAATAVKRLNEFLRSEAAARIFVQHGFSRQP